MRFIKSRFVKLRFGKSRFIKSRFVKSRLECISDEYATLKVLKSIAEILVIFENEEEQDFLSYEYSTYEYTIHRTHRTYRRFGNIYYHLMVKFLNLNL